MDASDQSLILEWARRRDERAFLAIVERYGGLVYGTCRRIVGDGTEAEDVAQECFEQLAVGGRKTGPNLGAWLHRHATYRSLNRLREARRREARERRYAREVGLGEQNGGAGERVWDDIYGFVDAAIDELPEKLRVAVVERFLCGQTVEAIAAKNSVTRQTVHNRINAGLERIRKSLARRRVALSVAGLAALFEANACEAASAVLIARLGRLALSGAAVAPAGGFILQSAWVKAVAAAVIVLAGGAVFFMSLGKGDEPAAPPDPVAREEAEPAPAPEPAAVGGVAPAGAPEPAEDSQNVDAGVVHGLVMTEDLTPVPGTVVAIVEAHHEEDAVPYRVETVCDEEGRFRFERLPLRKRIELNVFDWSAYKITAEAGELTASVYLAGTHPLRETYLELVLYPNTALGGTVTGPMGEPVIGATVRCEMQRYAAPSPGVLLGGDDAKTDANGYFKIQDLFPGDYTLEVSAPGYATANLGPYATGAADLAVRLESSGGRCVVRGRVVEVESGAPLADCAVGVNGETVIGYRPTYLHTKSDEGGEFVFEGLLPDTYRLSFYQPPYALLRKPEPVVLESPGQERVVTLEVARGATISGVVKESGGTGVADLEVYADRVDKELGGGYGTTAADGAFRIEGLAGGEYEVRAIEPATRQRASVKVVVETGRDHTGMELTLPDRLCIAGVVVDGAGRPLGDASVLVKPEYEEDRRPDMACGVSDEDGAFKIPVGLTGVLYVQAVHESGISRCVGPLSSDDARLQGLTLEVVPGARVEGVTVDSLGKPVEHVVVLAVAKDEGGRSFMPTPCVLNPNMIFASDLIDNKLYESSAAALSAKSGTFIVYPLPAGDYVLKAFLPSSPADAPAASSQVRLAEGETIAGVRLQLNTARLASIKGIVTRAGKPVKGQCVEAYCEDGRNVANMVYTDRDGRYHIGNLMPGGVSVSLDNARNGGAIIDDRRHVTLQAGETLQADFHMAQGTAVVEGRVLVNGAPAANINVSFDYDGNVNNSVRAKTDGQGNYRAENLVEGSYDVTAINFVSDAPDNLPFLRMTKMEIGRGENGRLDWDIEVSGIRGTIAGMGPGEKGVVALFPHDAEFPDLMQLTPEAVELLGDLSIQDVEVEGGKYTLTGVEPGAYVIGAAVLPQEAAVEDVGEARYMFEQIGVVAGQWLQLDLAP